MTETQNTKQEKNLKVLDKVYVLDYDKDTQKLCYDSSIYVVTSIESKKIGVCELNKSFLDIECEMIYDKDKIFYTLEELKAAYPNAISWEENDKLFYEMYDNK